MPWKSAILAIDVQRDFLPPGKLAIKTALFYLANILKFLKAFTKNDVPIIAVCRHYPYNHISFAENADFYRADPLFTTANLLPQHCVNNTAGADCLIESKLITKLIKYATAPKKLVKSVFDDRLAKQEITDFAHQAGIKHFIIVGNFLEFSVLNTINAAINHNFGVIALVDAISVWNQQNKDQIYTTIKKVGVKLITTNELVLLFEKGGELWKAKNQFTK